MNSKGRKVCVVVGATSKWQSDGRMTALAHGHKVDDSELPVGVRWASAARSPRNSGNGASLRS